MGILNKTLSVGMDKQIHRYEKRVKNDINPLEKKYSAMTSDELRAANAALMDEARGEKPCIRRAARGRPGALGWKHRGGSHRRG